MPEIQLDDEDGLMEMLSAMTVGHTVLYNMESRIR